MSDICDLLQKTGWDNGGIFYKPNFYDDGYISVKKMTERFLEENNIQQQIQREFDDKTSEFEKEINELRQQVKAIKEDINMGLGFDRISEDEAQERVENCIKSFKHQDKKKINIIDLVENTNLPPEQIEKLMKQLSKKGVRETDD